jgi:hypothetical protein
MTTFYHFDGENFFPVVLGDYVITRCRATAPGAYGPEGFDVQFRRATVGPLNPKPAHPSPADLSPRDIVAEIVRGVGEYLDRKQAAREGQCPHGITPTTACSKCAPSPFYTRPWTEWCRHGLSVNVPCAECRRKASQ